MIQFNQLIATISPVRFDSELKKAIDTAQGKGLSVDVTYAPVRMAGKGALHSALVIGRAR